jgi:LysM repeat protein
MTMKKFLKMPLRRLPRRPPPESLRAKAAAEAETYESEEYEVEEPNMKFSHALIVVLALHIIAVGGVFAFNTIKAGQNSSLKASTKGQNAPTAAQAAADPKPVQQSAAARAGKTYTVQAGDTLSRIAALHKVGIEAIEKENGITSYSMIRVGQVLKIPAGNSAQKPEAVKPSTDPATAATKHAFLAARTDIANPPAPTTARTDTVNLPTPTAARTEIAKLPAATPPTGVAKQHAGAAKPLPTVAATPRPTQPSLKKVEEPAAPMEADTYVVAKGDNPYSIAKKLHVNYNELIVINDIKDPTRVQIGQKLKIPAKKN